MTVQLSPQGNEKKGCVRRAWALGIRPLPVLTATAEMNTYHLDCIVTVL